MKLYHGTTSRHLARILVEGLTPNNQNLNSNWEHTVAAGNDIVYLTNAYAMYFANQAISDEPGEEFLAVLEIDVDHLDEDCMVADEDAVEQTSRGKDMLPRDWSVTQRTVYYRERTHEYSWEGSLQALGTCGYQNTIPTTAITRIALISIKKFMQLIMGGYDPFICVMNYRLLGSSYRHAMRWLFDAGVEFESDKGDPFSDLMRMKLPEDRTGIEVFNIQEAKERFVTAL